MQDEIVARLANALNAQLVAAEARRAERAPNPDSMDLYFQGWAWWNRGVTPDNLAEARGFFDRALALDPGNVSGTDRHRRRGFSSRVEFPCRRSGRAFAAAEAAAVKA